MTYVPNIPGIELAGRIAGTASVAFVNHQILEAAEGLAPVATGAYKESLAASQDGIDGTVYSDIRYAPYLEFGTSDTPVFATLRQASEQANVGV
jgi:Bacteriophage protein of unknown function (DUF646).